MMKMSMLLPLGACAALFLEPLAAQTCRASVGGNYSYASLGNGIAGSLLNPPSTGTGTTTGTGTSTTTTTSPFSTTEVGSLLSGIAGTTPFGTAGTLHLEGGIITASNTPNFASTQQVGTYTVNSDCTISVTLTDTFSTATTGTGSTVTSSTPTPTKLQGVIMRNGSEIDLGVLQNTPTTTSTTGGTTTTTTTTTPAGSMLQSSSLIVLTRSLSTFCSASNLVGRYAIVATGTGVYTPSTTTTGTGTTTTTTLPTTPQVTPFYFFGIVNFDGAGNITASNSTPASSLSYLNYSGTYKVNPDCTGTMSISGVAPMTTTTTSTTGTTTTTTTTSNAAANTITLNFVLTQPVADVSASGQALSAGQAKARIVFTTSSSTQTLSGYGSATEQ